MTQSGATLAAIRTFPIKSCAPQQHTDIEVQLRGLAHDRRWLVTDPDGRFITGRQHGQMVRIAATPSEHGLVLEAPGMPRLEVSRPAADTTVQTVQIWKDNPPAAVAGGGEWLSQYLGMPAQLCYQREQDIRPVPPEKGGDEGDHVSFADAYPVLLIGTASLDDLNQRLPSPVTMGQFRTNLVAQTDRPYVEEDWRRVRIGDCEFDVASRCSRCVFTTVDPVSGQRDPSGEPFKTLRSYRFDKEKRGVMFGVNLIPRGTGTLRLASEVQVLATSAGPV